MILRILILSILMTMSSSLVAFERINLTSDCGDDNCEFLIKRVYRVLETGTNYEDVYNGIRFVLDDTLIKKFKFNFTISGKEITFHFSASINSFLQNVIFESDANVKNEKDLYGRLDNLKVPFLGKVFDRDLKEEVRKKTQEVFMDLGFLDSKITTRVSTKKNRVTLIFNINAKKRYIVKEITAVCGGEKKCANYVGFEAIRSLIGKSWKKRDLSNAINLVVSKKRLKGFYDFFIDIDKIKIENKEVFISLKINQGVGHNFFISGTEKLSKIKILNHVKKTILQERTRIDASEIKNIINVMLEENGFFSSSVKVNDVSGLNKSRNKIINHFIKIRENNHTRVSKINISGVSIDLELEIKNLLAKNQSNFHIRGYYLESDFQSYNSIISEYLKSVGYYFSEVFGPYPQFSKDKTNVLINFKVHLGNKVVIRDIDYGFSEKILNKKFIESLENQVGGIYFSENIKNDKEAILSFLQERGYFYARERKLSKKNEFFTDNFQKVLLDYNINPGKKIKIGKVKVTGLKKTRKDIVYREISIKSEDLLTPSAVEQVNNEIVPLNLFSFVSVKPSKVYKGANDQNYADLIIQVNERDYGVIRLSPGFRSDLGYKVESFFQRSNIMGKNEAFSLNLRGNKRTSLSYLDSRRQGESRDLIEFAGVSSYTIPYILGSKIRLQTNAELVRRRFYGFDADIGRVSFRLTKNFNEFFGTSFRYQFENIKQYDATQLSDSGYFRIGSIMSSLFIDLRDRVVNPQKGSYHGLSAEVGNPSLLSMQDENLEINFVKIVSRNRVYHTIGGITLAASLSAGYQRNLADDYLYAEDGTPVLNEDGSVRTVGVVPSVKVFRLEGIDGVRGFSEEEINRLDDDNDILDKRIQGEAYLINTKFEIRRLLSESIVGAVFFDAGRLFVETFKPLKLRKSAGVSFKFLTPVGTLDFDYGLKLDRKSSGGGAGEMFGRFHLAIGFF